MKNTYVILLTTRMYFLIVECALAPEINFEGRLKTNNVSRVFQLSCSTNIAVQLCTAEFLIDEKTHDTIRSSHSGCYHSLELCSPTVCTCSDDCKSFTLKVTVTQDMMNNEYSCAFKYENERGTYSVNISIIQDGNGGSTIVKKNINPSNIVSPPQHASFSVPLKIVGASSGLLFLGIIIIVTSIICKKMNNDAKSEIEAENY